MSETKIEQPWAVDKYPIEKSLSPISGSILVPHLFRGVGGNSKISVYAGDDLNRAIFDYYAQPAPEGQLGTNYIDPEGLHSKRHEYLGPSPFIAGYKFDSRRRSIEIEFWDEFLKLRSLLSYNFASLNMVSTSTHSVGSSKQPQSWSSYRRLSASRITRCAEELVEAEEEIDVPAEYVLDRDVSGKAVTP
ncbi:hypothetical protein C8F01DRAFT_1243119 [Mycena amicta]|nr:hypothetical protein C8F01DRAFT_1243119 [Mycena amicta]